MKKHIALSLLTLGLLASAGFLRADSAQTFEEIMKSYEGIRLSLLEDSAEEIGNWARAVGEKAEKAAADDSTAEDVRPLLAKISGVAVDLAVADGLEAAREAFYELSKTMVQYRAKISGDELPVVMYCSMAKKSWLQLEEEVGNPYYGQAMASCGEVVSQ